MGKYVVESDFDDLHGNPGEAPDLELDLSDTDNPIIQAALSEEDENWKPPKKDDDDKDDQEEEDQDGDNEDEESDEDENDDDDDEGEELEEDEDEIEDEEDEDEEDDDKSYSKKVQARIDRERNLRLQERQESDARINKLERRAELRDAQDDFDKDQVKADTKLKALKAKKVAALDEGETSSVVDIDDEILDIKAERKAKQIQLDGLIDDAKNDDTTDTSTSGTPPEGKKWLDKYPEFKTNSQFRNVVLAADKMVAARGLDKNTEGYYLEMENIVRPQFPGIIKKKAVKVKTKARKKKSAVGSTTKAGTRRRTASKRSRRGRIRLTKADQQQMEIFGLDPHNPEHAKSWAESKST